MGRGAAAWQWSAGAMVFGGVATERLQLNEDTLWSGAPSTWNTPTAQAALPSSWRNGRVKGLCTRGGFTVDLEWREGKLVQAVIHSKLGQSCQVQYREPLQVLANGQPIATQPVQAGTIQFVTTKASEYLITIDII